LPDPASNPAHLAQLERWMRSYRPGELFDDAGRPRESLRALVPVATRRMGANPRANGGRALRDLVLPDFRRYAAPVEHPGVSAKGDTVVLGAFLRDVIGANEA